MKYVKCDKCGKTISISCVDSDYMCDGEVLKQNPTKPVYEATLVKYGNIICENPYKQIKIKIKE